MFVLQSGRPGCNSRFAGSWTARGRGGAEFGQTASAAICIFCVSVFVKLRICISYFSFISLQNTKNIWNTVILFETNTGVKQGDSLSTILLNLWLQKAIQSTKLVPRGVKFGKEQLNVLAYADGFVIIFGKTWNRNKTNFCRNIKHCQKIRITSKQRENKIYESRTEKQFKTK